MAKKKLILLLGLIVVLSLFLSGCAATDFLSDYFCCGAFLPLPIAAVLLKLTVG